MVNAPFGTQLFDLFIVAFWGFVALGLIAWRYGWLHYIFKSESP